MQSLITSLVESRSLSFYDLTLSLLPATEFAIATSADHNIHANNDLDKVNCHFITKY